MFKDKYNRENLKNKEINQIIETTVDSIYARNTTNHFQDFSNFLNAKADSLLLSSSSLKYFNNDLNIYGNSIYYYSIAYIYSLLLLLQHFSIEVEQAIKYIDQKTQLTKTHICNKYSFISNVDNNNNNGIENTNVFSITESNICCFISYIKENEITPNVIYEMILNKHSNSNMKDYINISIWKSKIKYFLNHSLNGGVTNNIFNTDILIFLIKTISLNCGFDYILVQQNSGNTEDLVNNANNPIIKNNINNLLDMDMKKISLKNFYRRRDGHDITKLNKNSVIDKSKTLLDDLSANLNKTSNDKQSEEIFKLINNEILLLLDFQIVLKNKTIDNDLTKLNFYLDNQQLISHFICNKEIINKLLEKNILKSFLGIVSYSQYSNFFLIYLKSDSTNNSKITIDFLDSFLYYIKELTIKLINCKNENYQELLDERMSLLSLILPFANLYKSSKLNPLVIIKLTKIFCILSCTKYDKAFKTKLLQEEILNGLINYLDFPNEIIIFNSLKLLLNLIPEISENLIDILDKYDQLVSKIISKFITSNIPEEQLSINIVCSSVKLVINFLKISPVLIRDVICLNYNITMFIDILKYLDTNIYGYLESNTQIIKYESKNNNVSNTNNIIVNNTNNNVKENFIVTITYTNDELVDLRNHIFIMLDHIIRNNSFLKKLLFNNDLFKIIEDNANTELLFLRKLVILSRNKNKNDELDRFAKERLKSICSFLKFMFFYFVKNREAISQIMIDNKDCNFSQLVNFINENYHNSVMGNLLEPIESINIQLNEFKYDDED